MTTPYTRSGSTVKQMIPKRGLHGSHMHVTVISELTAQYNLKIKRTIFPIILGGKLNPEQNWGHLPVYQAADRQTQSQTKLGADH